MELNLAKQTVSINEVIYDGTAEQPIECDVLLPDYCPDIQKILRCEVVPSILSSMVNGDKLAIDGMAVAHLYYLDEERCIRHTEYKIPYTKVIELRTAPITPTVCVSQSVEYFNCRAVSQRRLDMRGAVTMAIKVTSQGEEEVVCDATGMGMQLCHDRVENIKILPQVTRQLTIREEVELGSGKSPIGGVIRYNASAEVVDYKVITSKVITKGEVSIKIIYACEEDSRKLDMMEYALPVSQIIDIDNVDEDCLCNVWYDVCSVEITPKRDPEGENRIFSLEIAINACATAHRKVELEACSDCYSTCYECKQQSKQVPFLQLVDIANENCMYKETLDLPPNVKGIIDTWCVASSVMAKVEKDCIVVSGKLNICMFVYEEDDEIAYYDQMQEFTHKIQLSQGYDAVMFSPMVRVDATTFSMTGHEKIEVRCTIKIKGSIYNQYRKNVLCDVSVDESRCKSRQDNLLYLYYPTEKESVWDIAKRYNTSVAAIMDGNHLEDKDLGAAKMLIIPMK